MQIATILYHDVVENGWDESGYPGAAAARYKLSRATFARHIRSLADVGRAVTVDSALAHPCPGTFLFTVDDGGSCSLHIADTLEAHGWRGHFFVPTDVIDTPGFVTREDVRELDRRGHVVGSHSCSHPAWMSELPDRRLYGEWERSCAILADLTGRPTAVASVPGGYYAPRVADAAARAGIAVLFNSQPTAEVHTRGTCRVLGRYCVRRGDTARFAAALVAGVGGARTLQTLAWKAKGAVKLCARPYMRMQQSMRAPA